MFVYGFDDLSRAQLELIDALAAAGRGDRRGRVRRPPRARARGPRLITALQRARRRGRRGAPVRGGLHLQRDPAPPRPGPVRARGRSASRSTTGSCCSSRPGRGARPRRSGSRSPACCAPATSPTRSRSSLRHPDPARAAARGRAARDGDPGRARVVAGALGDPGRRRADRALPSRRRRGRGRLAARPPAARPVPDAGRRRHGRGADPPRRRDHGRARRSRTGSIRRVTCSGCARPRPRRSACARSPAAPASSPSRRTASGRRSAGAGEVPFSALELRAGVAAAELLTELAGLGGAARAARSPSSAGAIEAIESASVPLWRGPATGRVRILDPYRARAARARALFCLSLQDGVFPSAAPPDPLLSEERRREIGNPDLRRTDPADEERYLFHSCVSRPTERLYLSWQGCDEDGTALARSPFLDEVCDLLDLGPDGAAEPLRKRGPERAVPAVAEATSERDLARALALGGWAFDREPVLERRGRGRRRRRGSRRCSPDLCDPNLRPGPLRSPDGARGPRRARGLLRQLARGLGDLLVQVVRRARARRRSGSSRPPTRSGSARSSTTRSTASTASRRAPTRSRGPATSAAGSGASASCSTRSSPRTAGPLNHARRAALERARAQVEAFLAAEAETETEFRPRPDLLEVAFGPFDDRGGRRERERAARSATSRCAGGSTGSTSTRPGAPSSATTRPARTSPRRTSSPSGARCRSSSTCGSPSGSWASTSVGGPLPPARRGRRAQAARARRPRGRGPQGTRDRRHRPARARGLRARARRGRGARARLRRRDARRRDPPPPDRRQVPQVLQLPGDLPARAGDRRRRERQRRMSALEGQLTLAELEPAAPEPAAPAPAPAAAARPRRSSRPASSATRSPPASATPSSRPAPARARPRCSSTATAPRSPTTASRSTGSSPSRSPSAPRPRCAPGCAAS